VPEIVIIAIFGLGITAIEIKPPKARLSTTKKGMELSQRHNNLVAEPSLDMDYPYSSLDILLFYYN